VLEILGRDLFAADVLTLNGLDDRRQSQGVVSQAEDLMADAVRDRGAGADRKAVGRVVAEMVSPYPPGVPVLAPGERVTREVVDYLTTGIAAGMLIPDAADPSLESLRVVAE
jgi:arginine/lysine/ornithine decarboxylase